MPRDPTATDTVNAGVHGSLADWRAVSRLEIPAWRNARNNARNARSIRLRALRYAGNRPWPVAEVASSHEAVSQAPS